MNFLSVSTFVLTLYETTCAESAEFLSVDCYKMLRGIAGVAGTDSLSVCDCVAEAKFYLFVLLRHTEVFAYQLIVKKQMKRCLCVVCRSLALIRILEHAQSALNGFDSYAAVAKEEHRRS